MIISNQVLKGFHTELVFNPWELCHKKTCDVGQAVLDQLIQGKRRLCGLIGLTAGHMLHCLGWLSYTKTRSNKGFWWFSVGEMDSLIRLFHHFRWKTTFFDFLFWFPVLYNYFFCKKNKKNGFSNRICSPRRTVHALGAHFLHF